MIRVVEDAIEIFKNNKNVSIDIDNRKVHCLHNKTLLQIHNGKLLVVDTTSCYKPMEFKLTNEQLMMLSKILINSSDENCDKLLGFHEKQQQIKFEGLFEDMLNMTKYKNVYNNLIKFIEIEEFRIMKLMRQGAVDWKTMNSKLEVYTLLTLKIEEWSNE